MFAIDVRILFEKGMAETPDNNNTTLSKTTNNNNNNNNKCKNKNNGSKGKIVIKV